LKSQRELTFAATLITRVKKRVKAIDLVALFASFSLPLIRI